MNDRSLKLNSVDRYVKSSPRYVLEEHGHCEVPAGCGGVVLRWRNAVTDIPFEMWLYVNGAVTLWVDGARPRTSRPLLAPGAHVIALNVGDPPDGAALLMFAALAAGSTSGAGSPVLASRADGTWRWTDKEPADDAWKTTGFDDSAWAVMVPAPLPEGEERDMYAMRRVEKLGGQPLGTGTQTAAVWIRKAFELTSSGAAEA
jgi:hypothetical protein